jgi:NitT/TauT family transport system substrate-binding protein
MSAMQRVRIIVIGVLMTLAISGVSVRAQKSNRLAVGYGSISTNYLPLWMAREAGIFRKNGLDVDTVFFTSSPTAFMALLAGETAITINPGPDVVNAHLAGADVVFVAGGTVALDWWLVSRPEIKTPSLLRGGAVGISRFGSSSEFIARYALQKIGLTPGKDATIVQIGSPLSRQAAMDTGKVQATVYTAIHTFTAEKKGFNVLADLATLGLPYQNAAVVTTRKLIREKPEIIGRFVRSQLEAVHLLKTDRENGVKVLAKYMQGLNDREVLEKAYDRAVAEDMLPRKQYPSLEGIKTVLDTLVEQNPRIKTVKLETFVDPRFIQELDANGFIDGLYKRR